MRSHEQVPDRSGTSSRADRSGRQPAPGLRRAPAPSSVPLHRALDTGSPEAVLALQRAAGNSAVTAVQRARTGRPTGVSTIGGDNAYFTTQAPEGVLRDGPSPNGMINHDVDHVDVQHHHPADVSLQISDDGTLAVHDTAREPKEFYASDQVFQQAVAQLAAVNSDYTLVRGGGQIKTEAGTLSKVTPETSNGAAQRTAAGFAALIQTQCIEVARKVVGAGRPMRIVAGDGTSTATWAHSGGERLAHHLTETVRNGGTTDAAGAAAAAENGPGAFDRDVAPAYGSTLRQQPGEADDAARDMGINNHVRPEVGEAFATLSIGDQDEKDYATVPAGETFTDRAGTSVWNYHFAGVVARALDGNDWVTLENYTRNSNADNALLELEGKLMNSYLQKTRSLLNGYKGKQPKGELGDRITQMLQKLTGATRDQAQAEFQALGQKDLEWQGKWFFRLYGSQPGQTFHDKQYANGAGDFVNPLTVRVRRP